MGPDWRDAYRGRTAMVLGASGFIGRWVARALLARGATVAAVARSAPAAREALGSGRDILLVEADLSREAAVRAAVATVQPDLVFNLAGYGVDRGERDALRAEVINAALPQWLVAAMASSGRRDWPGQQVVHAGSALEYGIIAGDLAEDSAPHPTTQYGITKLAGTRAVASACAAHGVRGLTARLFTVYGAGEHDGRLLPTLLAARAHHDAVPLSDGRQRRDFTYVEDVAEGMLRLGVSDAAPGAVVNLATGTLVEVRAFIERAAAVLGLAPARLEFGALPTRAEEMQHDPVAVGRLRALVDWVPATDIAEGVRRTASQPAARA